MQHINSLLINSNLALHFVLVHITFYTEIWHYRSNVSWPCLHIKHSFSCSFLHNSHSKRWPGISNLPFLGSSSKFCWRRSNPERIIVRRAHFWSELTSLLRGSCNILKERLPKPFFQLSSKTPSSKTKGNLRLGQRHSHVFCSKHVQNSDE